MEKLLSPPPPKKTSTHDVGVELKNRPLRAQRYVRHSTPPRTTAGCVRDRLWRRGPLVFRSFRTRVVIVILSRRRDDVCRRVRTLFARVRFALRVSRSCCLPARVVGKVKRNEKKKKLENSQLAKGLKSLNSPAAAHRRQYTQ